MGRAFGRVRGVTLGFFYTRQGNGAYFSKISYTAQASDTLKSDIWSLCEL